MAIPVEQFTAPGKYEYDLAMESIESHLKNPSPLYRKMENDSEGNNKFRHKLHYISFNIEKK